MIALTEVIRKPLNMPEVRRSKQRPYRRDALKEELAALEENDTFKLVDAPENDLVLDNTVQFRVKVGSDGAITRYNARVCARGDRQVYEIQYLETYAPVAAPATVRVFLVLVAKFNLHVRQGDVPPAYVKAELRERVFKRQVKGFEKAGHEQKIRRLRKALYGLKQAGRAWHMDIDRFLKSLGLNTARASTTRATRVGCFLCDYTLTTSSLPIPVIPRWRKSCSPSVGSTPSRTWALPTNSSECNYGARHQTR
ncbi:hypothetical protein PF008_g23473 [Phytophthora fragariae]|uniref:Reverse transcriptase Ty1/copia-type domain-containing protein n=1 Tax=Phytophthora fragariae TaxID=53985 RepID=A0A6G0QQQ6_9STRA|nr:hypothetical protein PF008_g23473 [Phytophthora fragariae]